MNFAILLFILCVCHTYSCSASVAAEPACTLPPTQRNQTTVSTANLAAAATLPPYFYKTFPGVAVAPSVSVSGTTTKLPLLYGTLSPLVDKRSDHGAGCIIPRVDAYAKTLSLPMPATCAKLIAQSGFQLPLAAGGPQMQHGMCELNINQKLDWVIWGELVIGMVNGKPTSKGIVWSFAMALDSGFK